MLLLLKAVWSIGLVCSFFLGGSAYILLFDEPEYPAGDQSISRTALPIVAAAIGIVTISCGLWLWQKERKKTGFISILTIMTSLVALTAAEVFVRKNIPTWPSTYLHGIPPEQAAAAWAYPAQDSRDPGINSWGQRDRERSLRPTTGEYRIAFIGDSFLEEGTTPPVSLLVESELNDPAVEVINLGVSATGPDEYYDRIRSVALPLRCSHCVLFLFAGNDFVSPARTLSSFAGFAAVSPRRSFLTSIGLHGINHLLTNKYRPVIHAWMSAGGLYQQEKSLHDFLIQADDVTARQALLFADELPPDKQLRLAKKLNSEGINEFLQMLRTPDAGRFRSYYLSNALWAAAEGNGQWDRETDSVAWYWIEQAATMCRSRDVGFLLVIVPEAFQVDPRMRSQWEPLVDMQKVTRPCRDTAIELRQKVEAAKIDVLDLHDVLDGVEGSYLNLDGHWSVKGGELVACAVAEKLREQLQKSGGVKP